MLAFKYEVFFSVATHLSFSKAASELFISQPAISKQVKNLEMEIGIALFERHGNTIKPTRSGKKLFENLQKAKLIQRQIQSDFDLVKGQLDTKGELKIGASTTISLYVMPKILSAFHKKYPLTKILLINRNSENVLKALVDQEIDLACIETNHQINTVQYQPFMKDEIISVCSSKSPYGRKGLKVAQLKEVPLALRERGSGTLSVLTKELEKHSVKMGELNIIARLGGTEALKNYLVAGEAIGFLSRLSVEKELTNGELREIKIDSFRVEREFNFVMRKGEESIGMLRYFIKESMK